MSKIDQKSPFLIAVPTINVVRIDEEEPIAIAVPQDEVVPIPQHHSSPPTPFSSVASPQPKPPSMVGIRTSSAIPIQEEAQVQNPGRNEHQSYEDVGFDCLFCGDTKTQRVRLGNNFFLSLCGNTYIDMRRRFIRGLSPTERPPQIITMEDHTVRLFVLRLCGDTKVIVPRGTHVVIRRLLLCGDKDTRLEEDFNHHQGESTELPVRLVLYTLKLCGNIRVRSEGLIDDD